MSSILADVDATCASLGYFDGKKYIAELDAIQGLKVLIYIKTMEYSLKKSFYFSI